MGHGKGNSVSLSVGAASLGFAVSVLLNEQNLICLATEGFSCAFPCIVGWRFSLHKVN